MSKTIVMVVTLDTKGEDTVYLNEEIKKRNHNTTVIDVGVLGKPQIKADISREEVARAGGKSLRELVREAERGADRASATNVMISGVKKIVKELYAGGKLDGIISLGGTTGASLGIAAMMELPIGVPKLMVTTHALNAPELGDKDITMMQTPADIMGLNSVMRRTLANAAGAIAGMVETEITELTRPLVGITAVGLTTPAVLKIRPLLEARGYDPIVLNSRNRNLVELIEDGRISGIIDLTPREILNPLSFNPPQTMAEGKLKLAGEKGIPQVIAPGSFDMIIISGTKEMVPPAYRGRTLHIHGPRVVTVRTSKEELKKAAQIISERANRAVGPVSIVIPRRGFSDIDKEGHNFYAPDIDEAFAAVVKSSVNERVDVVEVEANINDDEFARAVVAAFDKVVRKGGAQDGAKY